MVKIFGIGNVLLCDDSIGVRIAEALYERINRELNKDTFEVEVIQGNTDYLYCINNIDDNDFVIIIDSTCFMIRPGLVTTLNFNECDEILFSDFTNNISSHDESLLRILRRERKNVQGYLIGVEVDKIEYSLELSKRLKRSYNDICENVYNQIIRILEKENLLIKCREEIDSYK